MENKRKNFRSILTTALPTLIVVVSGIALYLLLTNVAILRNAINTFFAVLSPVILGLVFAFIVNIPMTFFEKKVFKKMKSDNGKRALSLLISVIIVVLLITGIVWLVIPRIIKTVSGIVSDITANWTTYTANVMAFIDRIAAKLSIEANVEQFITDGINDFLADYMKILSTIVPGITDFVGKTIGLVVNSLLAIIFGIYMLAGKEKYIQQIKNIIIAVFPRKASANVLDSTTRVNKILRKYIFSTFADCFILGLMTFIALTVFFLIYEKGAADFALIGLLSVIIAITQIIPVIGPWIGGGIGALLIIWGDPIKAIWFIVIILIVQQIDNNIVYPKVIGENLGISGLWVLTAVLVGAKLFGIVGTLVCVPVTAIIFELSSEWMRYRVKLAGLATEEERDEFREKYRRRKEETFKDEAAHAVAYVAPDAIINDVPDDDAPPAEHTRVKKAGEELFDKTVSTIKQGFVKFASPKKFKKPSPKTRSGDATARKSEKILPDAKPAQDTTQTQSQPAPAVKPSDEPAMSVPSKNKNSKKK